MKETSLAPSFAVVYPVIAEAARSVGYALAIHGSMARDLDLIAVPWTCDSKTPQDLISAICEATGGTRNGESTMKPHGRLSAGICLGCGGFVDLSIMVPDPLCASSDDPPYCKTCGGTRRTQVGSRFVNCPDC